MKFGKGYRLQSGIEHRKRVVGTSTPNGLLMRGAAIATYVTDNPNHPRGDNPNNLPVAVYCDVIVYGSLPYNRWFTLSKVLVSQKRGGLHNDDIWKPRATSKNINTDFNDTVGANPGDLDGDHVLIGFMNNSFDEPIIIKGLPHPARDIANDLYPSGKRLKLKLIDGDPDLVKHHGVFSGVDDSGNYIVDSTFGNDGTTSDTGEEPLPDTQGNSGNQEYSLPKNSVFSVILKDMSNPLSPVDYAKFMIKFEGGNIEFVVDNQNSIRVDGSGEEAEVTIGNGMASAAVANLLETLWNSAKAVFSSHTHPLDIGNNVTLVSSSVFPSWNDDIKSDKLTFPFN